MIHIDRFFSTHFWFPNCGFSGWLTTVAPAESNRGLERVLYSPLLPVRPPREESVTDYRGNFEVEDQEGKDSSSGIFLSFSGLVTT